MHGKVHHSTDEHYQYWVQTKHILYMKCETWRIVLSHDMNCITYTIQYNVISIGTMHNKHENVCYSIIKILKN